MALRLNPKNSEILAYAAHMPMLRDGSERALELAEKAIAMNPGHPPWYCGPLANYYLLKGDRQKALESICATYPDTRTRKNEIVESQCTPPKIVALVFGE